MSERFKIVIYVPPAHAEAVKDAAFTAGAGTIGQYSRVSFAILGTGSFIPSPSSNPAIGTPGQGEVLDEVRIEITAVGRDVVKRAVEGVRRVHPYEEVVVDVYRLEDF